MKKYKNTIDDFFKWVKGTELVELTTIDTNEDPVRPELDLSFRITHGRKIFGLKYNNEIEAIVCVAMCPEVPFTVREMDYMSRAAYPYVEFKDKESLTVDIINKHTPKGEIAVAYTVWSRKRGAGREIIQKLGDWAKKQEVKRLVTLSPLTPMATHFHIKNCAKQVHINDETQNFEYKL